VALVGANSGAVTLSRHATSGFAALRNSGYLRLIGSMIALVGLISALLDYVFKVQASLTLAKGPALIGFFAAFYMATSVLAAVLQTLFARRALHRLGLARTLAILPAAVLLSGALGAVVQRLWSAALLRGTATVLESSLFRSGYEPLYTPLSADKKRSSKTIIDVALSRLGDALGGGLILGLLLVRPEVSLTVVVGMAMAGSALALWVANRLHRGYVDELATSLRSNAPSLLDVELEDPSASPAISQTQMEFDRERLLSQLAALRSASPSGSSASAAEAAPLRPASPESSRLDASQLLAAAHDLISGDAARARALLARLPLDARLVVFAIPLLEHAELSLQATAALKSVAHETTGQLIDAMLDPSRSVVVRRRLPRVLASYQHPRAVRGLIEALREPALAVRKRAALALAALVLQQPELGPPDRLAFEAVQRELREAEGAPLDLQHVFVILSLALDREALELARRALRSQDDQQRGTALEYLESVLPEPLKSELWAHLKDSRRASQRTSVQRPSEQVLDELKRSTAGRRRKRQPLPESP
jgi:hypothetical protein